MDSFVKVVVLENGFEAQLLCGILDEEGIAYYLKSYHDIAYDGLFQSIGDWGAIYAAETNSTAIAEILVEIRRQAVDATR